MDPRASITIIIAGLILLVCETVFGNVINNVPVNGGGSGHTVISVDTKMLDTTASTTKYLNTTRPFIGENVNASSTLIGQQVNRLELSLAKGGSPTGTADAGVFHFTSSTSIGNVTHMNDQVASADNGVSQQESIVMAMYFSPGSGNTRSAKWLQVETALDNYPTVNFIGIINPNSGPGNNVNFFGNYTDGINQIVNRGGKVVAYIPTGYGARSQSSLINNYLHNYTTFYPGKISGVFFDEMQNTNNATLVAYYTNLTRTVHAAGLPLTICNPGADTKDIYINSCDKIMIEEGNGSISQSRLQGQATATNGGSGVWWHERFPQSNFVYSAYNMPTFNATTAKAIQQNYVSGFYWTNGTGAGCPNSGVWNCVPSYLEQEFQVIKDMQHSTTDKLRSSALEYAGPSSSLIGKTIMDVKIPLQIVGTQMYGNYSIGVFYENMTSKAEFGNGYVMDLPTTSTTIDFTKPTTSQTFSNYYRVIYNNSNLASRGMFNATGGTTIWAERASSTSVLLGKSINNIEIPMSREGSPTGTMMAGVFDASGNTKFTFGTIDVSTIATGVHYYSFTNTGSSYTVVAEDRIGVKYNTGGAGVNLIRVYEKTVDRFDGTGATQTYRERWNWDTQAYVALTSGDAILDINKVTIASVPSSYTIQSGDYVGVYYPWGNLTQYLNTKVDNTNSFDGTNSVFAEETGITSNTNSKDQTMQLVQTGVTSYNVQVTKVKDFGSINVSGLTGSPSNVTFSLGAGDSYTFASGDFVGIRYNQTGLTTNDYVTVVQDTNPADPFDGTNSRYADFTPSTKNLNFATTFDINGALKMVTSTFVPGTGNSHEASANNAAQVAGFTAFNIVAVSLMVIGAVTLLAPKMGEYFGG